MNNTISTNTSTPLIDLNSTEPIGESNSITNVTVLALKKFYLLPIETASDVETAEEIAPRVLGVFFCLCMVLGVLYTIYFIGKQVYMFCVAYSIKVHACKDPENQLKNYSNDAGLDWETSKQMTAGNLRLLNFSLLWCDEDEASDIYQVTSKLSS